MTNRCAQLIWSAALVSNATASSRLYQQSPILLCKDWKDRIVQYYPTSSYPDRTSPLHRISHLFDVNHFVVSQARPYLAPFLRSDLYHPDPKRDGKWTITMPLVRFIVREVQHWLDVLDTVGLVPASIRRFLLDEIVPGTSLTIVPQLEWKDFIKLLENPTTEAIDYWILKGERSVWPAVKALRIRCGIEFQLEQGYQLLRRRTSSNVPIQFMGGQDHDAQINGTTSGPRQRAKSLEDIPKE